VGTSRDCPNFRSTLYYPRIGKSYEVQIMQVHSQGTSEQKPIKNFEGKKRGRIQGLPKFFSVSPIISGTGEATNFKFCAHILKPCPLVAKFGDYSRRVTATIWNFSGHPYWAHRAVVFTIAQFSCCIKLYFEFDCLHCFSTIFACAAKKSFNCWSPNRKIVPAPKF